MEQSVLKLEPSLLCAALAAATTHIGLMPTLSTTFQAPYNLARRLASIDHISGGRMGWNLVTSTHPEEAANFNQDKPLSSEARHARAREFLQVVQGLWDSWDDDAFMRDKATGQYFDRDKFHFLDHQGEYFKVRGPLDTARPPQGQLPIITAGASANSQDLAAECADLVYSAFAHFDMAKEYYTSVKAADAEIRPQTGRPARHDGIMPIVAPTRAEAQAKFDQLQELLDPRCRQRHAADQPVPGFLRLRAGRQGPAGQGQGRLPHPGPRPRRHRPADGTRAARGHDHTPTLRRRLRRVLASGRDRSPTDVADTMQKWFEEGAADGFNIQPPYLPDSAEDFVNLVVPELQRRGLFRTEYEGTTLRENLGLPTVPSRYAA